MADLKRGALSQLLSEFEASLNSKLASPSLARTSSRGKEGMDMVGQAYGADQRRRLEKAADLGANLDLFTPQALGKSVGPDASHLLTVLPPGKFQDFAARIPNDEFQRRPYTLAKDYPALSFNTNLGDVLRHYGEIGKTSGWHDVPELRFDDDMAYQMLGMKPGDMTQRDYPMVRSHEGRHRSMAADRYLKQPGSLTVVRPTDSAMDYFRYLDDPTAFFKNMFDVTDRKVLPEHQYYSPIWGRGLTEETLPQLPELFDEGGPVRKGILSISKRLAEGKPKVVKLPGVGEMPAYPIKELEDIAESFAHKHGSSYPIESFSPYDKEMAKKIADAYEEMRHDPHSYAVKRAYEALSDETMDQYKALQPLGIDFSFMKKGEGNPYAKSPSLGYHDLLANHRMSVFPTLQPGGFGTMEEIANNPLLKHIGKVGDLDNATVNDAFRIVHDIYGHYGSGNPFFRAPGEERAWRIHGRSYSDDALPAATTELRGQNSWLNEGPHGAFNKLANQDDTIYADQKAGLLPPWAQKAEGGSVEMAGGGDWVVEFVKKFDKSLSREKQKALETIRTHTDKTGNEGFVMGRDKRGANSELVKGNPTGVEMPEWYNRFTHLYPDEPFFTAHTHPTNTLSPSEGDLRIWGNLGRGSEMSPFQDMLINASPQNSVLRIGQPTKSSKHPLSVVSDVMGRDKYWDSVANPLGLPRDKLNDFLKGSGLGADMYDMSGSSQMMPSILRQFGADSRMNFVEPDLFAGSFLNDVAKMGVPIQTSAEHRIGGTRHLASDVWPEFDKYVRSQGFARGGEVGFGHEPEPRGVNYPHVPQFGPMHYGSSGGFDDGGSVERKPTPKAVIRGYLRKATNDLYSRMYRDPRVLAQEAAAQIAPESPELKRLFGVTREDLWNKSNLPGNISGLDILPPVKGRSRGSEAVSHIMTPPNEQRLIDILTESGRYPEISHGADSFYVMDPAYQRLKEMHGEDEAQRLYHRLNTVTGSMSPASPVDAELVRGTIANHLLEKGRFADLKDWGGIGKDLRAEGLDHLGPMPESMKDFPAHPYFSSAVLPSIERNLMGGDSLPTKPKVPLYIGASSIDELGRQSDMPVPDRHFARAVGLTNTRTSGNPDSPVSMAEARMLGPWFRDKIAGKMGWESVPMQARLWSTMGPQTGVETMLGKPKLELFSDLISKRAHEMGVPMEDMRDLMLTGKGYAAGGPVISPFDFGNLPDDPSLDAWIQQREHPPIPKFPEAKIQTQGGGGGGGLGQLVSMAANILPMFLAEGGAVGDSMFLDSSDNYSDYMRERGYFPRTRAAASTISDLLSEAVGGEWDKLKSSHYNPALYGAGVANRSSRALGKYVESLLDDPQQIIDMIDPKMRQKYGSTWAPIDAMAIGLPGVGKAGATMAGALSSLGDQDLMRMSSDAARGFGRDVGEAWDRNFARGGSVDDDMLLYHPLATAFAQGGSVDDDMQLYHSILTGYDQGGMVDAQGGGIHDPEGLYS